MRRYLVKLSVFPDLNKGTTLPTLQLCENIPIRKVLSINKQLNNILQAQDYWKPRAKNKMIHYQDPLIYANLENLLHLLTRLFLGGSM